MRSKKTAKLGFLFLVSMVIKRKFDPKVHFLSLIPFLPLPAVPHLSQKREGKRAPALAQCEHTVCFLRCD